MQEKYEVMQALFAVIKAETEYHTEGLTSDLECTRKLIDASVKAFTTLNVCDKCGAPNDGTHEEIYGGVLCTACHEDKREFVCSWNEGYSDRTPKLCHMWDFMHEAGYDDEAKGLIEGLEVGQVATLAGIMEIHWVLRIK